MKKLMLRLTPAALLVPVLALADITPPAGGLPTPVTSLGGLASQICAVAGWIFTFLIILAVIYVLVAAFRYLTAGGDPEKVKKANHTLIYAAVAVVVAVVAKGVPLIVGSFFTSSAIGGC